MNIAIVSAVLHGSEFIDFILIIYDILLSKNLYSHYFKSKREDQTKKKSFNCPDVFDSLKCYYCY